MSNNMKIAIIGTGQLGKSLYKLISLKSVKLFSKNEFDITNNIYYNKLLEYDLVINCAGYTDVIKAENDEEKVMNTNYHSPVKLANFLILNNIKFVHISSNYVFTPRTEVNFDLRNKDDVNDEKPIGVYSNSKYLADTHMPEGVIIIRPAWLHGSGKKNFITKVLSFNRDVVAIATDDFGSFTSGTMIARFINKVIELDLNVKGSFNICTDEIISRNELFKTYIRISEDEITVNDAKASEFNIDVKDIKGLFMDNTKIKQMIDIFSLEEEIKLWKMGEYE